MRRIARHRTISADFSSHKRLRAILRAGAHAFDVRAMRVADEQHHRDAERQICVSRARLAVSTRYTGNAATAIIVPSPTKPVSATTHEPHEQAAAAPPSARCRSTRRSASPHLCRRETHTTPDTHDRALRRCTRDREPIARNRRVDSRCQAAYAFGNHAVAIQPLPISINMTQTAKPTPCVRSAFVPPALPLPSLRMSTPPRS